MRGELTVPEEKERKPQMSKFVLPFGMVKKGTCSASFFPISMSSFTVVYPLILPSRRNKFCFGIPAFFAACVATSYMHKSKR